MRKNKNKSNFKLLRKIAVFVIAMTIFTIFAAGFNASASDYDNHWAKSIFDEWIRAGILIPDEYGNIYPESLITRGQLCSYINRIMGFATMADISQYTDTPYGSKYYTDMAVAVYAGYISPISGSALSPDGNITRGQVIDAFAKVARIPINPGDEAVLAQVRDASDIPGANRSTVAAAIVNGFLAGRPGYMIEPNDDMTVSETIALLDRLNSSKRVYAFPGRFGPDAGTVVSGYSSILAPGVTLQNAEISKNLDIQQETGEGEVNLNQVSVREKLLVNGGRLITLANNNIKEIQVNKRNANLVYVQDGVSEADTLIINGDNVTVDLNRGNKTRKIIINGINATVNAGENVRIEDLAVSGENARINLAKGARIDNADLDARTQIYGKEGSVGNLNVNPGGNGSEIEPRPGGNVNMAGGADVLIDNRPSSSAADAKRILSLAFDTQFTIKAITEDTSKIAGTITANDFIIDIDGSPSGDFSVSKTSAAEYNLIFSTQILPSSVVTVSGTGNLTGSATISQDSQPVIEDAIVNGLRTINVTVVNPENRVLSKDNFRLQIAGKDSDSFTVSAESLVSYNLNLAADIKNGQILTVYGKNGVAGTVSVSAVSAIKSIVFNDSDTFTVNTDTTAGNKIDANCFDISVNGDFQDFTVAEKSKTAYQITLPSAMNAGDKVTVAGKKYLTGIIEQQYVSPFKVSKVIVNGKTSITVTLSSAASVVLNTEKHSGAFQVLVNDVSIPVEEVKKDASDTKNTIYNLTVNLDKTQGLLTVNGVKESKNKGMVDYMPPGLVSVNLNDQPISQAAPAFRTEKINSKIIIEFTEPVFKQSAGNITNKDIAVSGAAFNISAGEGVSVDLSGAKVSLSANSVIIDLAGAKVMDPGIYTVGINNVLIFDALGNPCAVPDNNIFRFELKGTLPTAASTTQAANGDIAIKLSGTSADNFGNAMSLNGTVSIIDPTNSGLSGRLDINYRYISYDAKAKTIYVSRASLPPALDDPNNPVYLSGDIPYRVELYQRDYTREAGSATPASENPLTITRVKIDTQRPVIERIALNGVALYDRAAGLSQIPVKSSRSNAVIQVVFSKPVFEQPPSKKFTLVDNYGQAFNIDTANPLDPGENLSLKGVKPASSNRTVSIPLRSAAILNPGEYKLEIDPSLIFDAVGNTVDVSDFKDLPGFPNLTCYFSIVTVTPAALSVSQNSAGDILVRFTRYYTWLSNPYGDDLVAAGILRILDTSKPEGQQQIGNDIIPAPGLVSWNDANKTLIINRLALPENLSGNYAVELECPDYEMQITPKIKLVTGINNDPSVTLGGEKNIPVTPNAEQTRIIPHDAIIKIVFPVAVTSISQAKFTKDSLDVNGDINSYPFSISTEDGTVLDKSKITFSHTGEQVVINLTNAIPDNMLHKKITVAVNQMLVYDKKGSPAGNKISVYGFTSAMQPPEITSAKQNNTGGVQILFKDVSGDLTESMNTREYINRICGINDFNGSTVRIERRGEIIGYIPAENILGGVVYEGIAPDNILITKDALSSLVDLDGIPVTLDGGNYAVVLSHNNYADSRVNCTIDTKPPSLTGFNANVNGNDVSLSFTFGEEARISSISINGKSGSVTPQYPQGYNKSIVITFAKAGTDLPSDYTVTFTVTDNFGNASQEYTVNPFIPSVNSGLGTGQPISGFTTSADSVNGSFTFGEGSNFTSYIDKTTRRVTNKSLTDSLAASTDLAYDADLSAPVVTLKAEMTVTAPANAVSCNYAISKEAISQTKPVFDKNLTITGGKVVLTNDVHFTASKGGGTPITSAEMSGDRSTWIWTAEKLTDAVYYYVFEWTDGAGNVSYTYVRSEISGS